MSESVRPDLDADSKVELIADRDGVILRTEGDAEGLFDPAALTGRTILELFGGVDLPRIREIAAGTVAGMAIWPRRVMEGDHGGVIPASARLEALGDGRHVVATLSVTRRRAARHGDAAHLVRAASAEGVWDWDLPSGEVWWSAEMTAMLTDRSEATVGPVTERFDAVIHPDDMHATREALERLLSGTSRLYTVEARIRVASGAYRWFLVRGACERLPSGEPVRVAGSMLDIHDRRLAEERVAASERRYRDLTNSLPQIVWSARPDGAVVEANARFHELTGIQSGLTGDEAWIPVVHPDDRAPMLARWRRSVDTGEPYEFTFRLRTLTGDRWYLAQARAARGPSGEIQAWYGTGTDIHEAHLAEVARDATHRRLESTIDGASLGVWEWDIDSGDLVINERWAEILGYSKAELEPTTLETWRSLCHPDDLAGAEDAVRSHLRGETERYDFELRMLHRDGHEVWVRTCGRVLERDEDDRALRMYGLHEDVTERHRMHHRLMESEHRFRRLFEESAEAVLLIQGERIVEANAAAAAMFGAPAPAALCGDTISAWSPDRQPDGASSPARIRTRLEEASSRGHSRFEWVHVRADGAAVWVETILTSLPGTGMGEPIIHAVLRDIGDRKRLEASLKRSTAMAQAANQAKGEFLANMSHEIRTPMTAIIGFTELIERDLRTGDRTVMLHDAIATIRRNAENLLTLINDILDFSRIEAGRFTVEMESASPAAIIESVVDLMRVQADAGNLDLRMSVADDVPAAITTDPRRLRQILLNLVGNAIKFTRHGRVEITASVVQIGGDGEAGTRASGASSDGVARRLRIAVTDTGIGMLPEDRERVFDAFMQGDASTTREYGGTGLGLRISASLAEMLGGRITVESERGLGSTFTVDLPIRDVEHVSSGGRSPSFPRSEPVDEQAAAFNAGADADADADAGAEADAGGDSASRGPLHGVRLLLAEDAEDIRCLLTLLLQDVGAEIVVAGDGLEVCQMMDAAEAAGERFDAILMDMQMPVLDGYGATSRLRATGCTIPIIAVTAHARTGDRAQCLEAGCDEHLAKPCSQRDLVEVISRLLGPRRR